MEKLHDKHRQRMKQRFRDKGLDSFTDHEVLELLLFYGIPQRNTNETAHMLLNRFGSLSGVLEADYEELLRQKGLGENSATLVTLISALARRYEMDRLRERRSYQTREAIGEYLVNHFIGATREHVELLLFDAGMRMIDHITVHEGAVNSSYVSPERIAEYVFMRRASCFVIAHNHPGGCLRPTQEDIDVTSNIYWAFKPFNVYMIDHYLVAGGEYMSILAEVALRSAEAENDENPG